MEHLNTMNPDLAQEASDFLARIQRKGTLARIARLIESDNERSNFKAAYLLGLIALRLQRYTAVLYNGLS
jgi:hypothetical protein